VKQILPAAGAERDVGTTVTIVPSLGPPPVKVPAVRGDLLKDARQTIAEAGLLVEAVRHRFDGEVLQGHVIGVRPDTARLPRGTSVILIVSNGPKPVPVPEVRGMTEDRAVQALAAFDVVIEKIFSAKVDRGRAIGTDLGTGTELQPGERITLRISLGPEFFECPDFVGMSLDDARALAEQVGLRLSAVAVPGADGEEIVSQDFPEPGARVRYGTTVTVFYA
jgi:eukaryotic-like serine/threonine-protein kinase